METTTLPRWQAPRWFRTYGAAILYLGYALISLAYQWALAIPDELQTQSGTFSIEIVGKKHMSAVTSAEGTFLFSCASTLGGHPECVDIKDEANYVGKPAQVSWYRQPIFPGVTLNKLVTLSIDGNAIVTRAKAEAWMASRTRISLWTHLGVGLFILCLCICFLRKTRSN
ncbi:hypothetical protein [Pseudomonas fontis]|uniref:Transmembrane protein n=1 Tax=Pseudomonas fontis TaxID=2942633 RepID=A0ABT5NU38_9PSED|nr:hypothetical protein [Pseudomonas fontis]MDD0972983.1 hypothetical protein [Pseudomonas fontis]MDD0991685.1 hypothetical protein [Pseudomonas fontis]